MGVITDFFLASAADVTRVLSGWQLPPQPVRESLLSRDGRGGNTSLALAYDELNWQQPPQPNPYADPTPHIDTLPNVQCKGMLPDKLALLFASLTGVDTDQALDLILLGFLTGPPECEVTVQRLPSALTNALANADSNDLLRAARALEDDDIDRWGPTFRGTAKELSKILLRIQSLAQQGISSQSDMFVWTCT